MKNISWLIFDKVFALLVGLIVTVRIANYFGPSEYGLYEYALSIITITGVIVLLIDGRVVKKQYSEEKKGYIIYNTTVAKVILSTIAFIIGIIIMLFVDRGSKFNTIYLLLLINNIIINLGFGIQNYFEYELKSKNVVVASNIATLISSILQLVAITFGFSIIIVVLIILLSSLIKLMILYFQFKSSFNLPLIRKSCFDIELIHSIIKESTPLALAATASIIYHRIDQVMIGSMLSVTDVGIYSISNKMINVVAIVISPVQTSIFPRMIEWYNTNRKEYYKKYQLITSLMTWVYIIGTTFAFLIAPMIFNEFFSADYLKALDVFKIHVLGKFFSYNAVLRSSHFTLTKETNVMMKSQIIAVCVNIVLNYMLIPIIGIFGAALATAITECLSLFLLNVFFEKGREVFWLQLRGLNPFHIIRKDSYFKINI